MSSTHILIIDPHPLIAESLALLLRQHTNYHTRAVYQDTNILDVVREFQPRMIVVNIYYDSIEAGLETCRLCASDPADPTIIVLAERRLIAGESLLLDAISAGADSILIREGLGYPQLMAALADIEAGRSLLDPYQVRQALRAQQDSQHFPPIPQSAVEQLTRREGEIAAWIAEGTSTSQIASALHISERTVQTHISNILTKLGVRNRIEAVVYIHRWRQSINNKDTSSPLTRPVSSVHSMDRSSRVS